MPDVVAIHSRLRQARRAKPFMPFAVVLETGERYVVGEQLWCAFTTERMIIFIRGKGLVRFPLRKVVNVEVQSTQAA